MKAYKLYITFGIGMLFFATSCKKEEGCTDITAINYNVQAEKDNGSCEYQQAAATPYTLEIPQTFSQYLPAPHIPSDNPMTVEGVALGRKLFYENMLSGDNTMSCSSCHKQSNAFADPLPFSIGIDGIYGTRTSMPIVNVAWNYTDTYFWDGRANGVEDQALGPVVNPIELHEVWPNAVSKLQATTDYPNMFLEAFGSSTIDSMSVVKAIAQFERTLISGNAKFDKYLRNEVTLTPSEFSGFNIFMDEAGGDCFHCHGDATNPLWTDNLFHNNGLDATFTDNGQNDATSDPADIGKFKTPSLRNLLYTAPYMHDGRFATLDDVINHYSVGLQYSPTIDPLMKNVNVGGVQLNPQDRLDLKAFLLTLTDPDFLTNTDFSAP